MQIFSAVGVETEAKFKAKRKLVTELGFLPRTISRQNYLYLYLIPGLSGTGGRRSTA